MAAANPLSAVTTTAVSTPAVTSSEVTAAVSAAAAAAALMTSPRAATPLLFAFPQSGTYHPGGPTLTGNVTSQTAAATASVNLSAGSRSGLPYPPLYCHDSGLWTDGGGAAVAVVPTVGAAAAAVSKVTTAAAGLTLSPSHHSQAGPFVGAYPAGPPGTTTAYFATPAAVLHHQAGPFSVGSTAGGFAVAGGQIQSQLGLQSHQQQMAVRQRVASGMSGQQGAGMSSDKMGYFLSHHHHHHHPHGQSAAAAAAVQSTVGGGTLSRTPSSVPNSTPQSKARPPLVNLQATTQHYVSAKLANSTNFHQVAQQQQVAGSGGGGGRGHSLHSPHPQQQQRNLQPQQPQAMLNTTNSGSVVTPSSPSTRPSHQQRPSRIRPSIVENSEGVVRSATTNPVDNRLAEPAEEAGGSTTVTTGGGGGGGGTSLMDDLMDTAEASAIMEVLFQQVPDIEEQVALATAADSAAAVATGGVTAANSEGRGGGTRSCSEEATGDAAGQRATASQEEQNYLNLVEAEKKSRHDSAMS